MKNPALNASLQTRLGLCAAALAGTAAAVPQAEAAIVTFNTPIVIPQTSAGVYLNFLTGQTGGSGGTVPGWDWNPYNSNMGTQLGFYWPPTTTSGGVTEGPGSTVYADLPPGSIVSSTSTFVRNINTTSNFRVAGEHILGFRFLNENTGIVNYGYAVLQTSGGTGFPATIRSWSFEDTGAAITVVPEPSTVAMLAFGAIAAGAAGLRRYRRQRAAA